MTDLDWYTHEYPELRSGPPWVMQEMIAAQPAVIEALLGDPPDGTPAAAEALSAALAQEQPVVVCGCGTSEHAARAVAAVLAAAAGPQRAWQVRAQPAMTAALLAASGVCLAVSHDGETRATILALEAARAGGAQTIAITHQGDGGVALVAGHVLVTPVHDASWCHTVAYTSGMAAGAALAAQVGSVPIAPASARGLLERVIALTRPAAEIARHLADRRVVLCVGAGADQITARELSLKIAEGARLPAFALELETVLHGQLAGAEPLDGLVIVAITDDPEHDRVARRAAHVARAAAAIGLPVAGLLSAAYDRELAAELTPAGRLVIELPDPGEVDGRLAGLLAGAGALQTLTLELAHARGTNPDLIRREQAPYRRAAEAAESAEDW